MPFFLKDSAMTNLNYAFEVAEKHLDIPKMLDAEGKLFVSALCAKLIIWWKLEQILKCLKDVLNIYQSKTSFPHLLLLWNC